MSVKEESQRSSNDHWKKPFWIYIFKIYGSFSIETLIFSFCCLPLWETLALKAAHFSIVWPSACTHYLSMKGPIILGCFYSTLVCLGTADLVLYTNTLLLGDQQSLSFVLLYALVSTQALIIFSHLRLFLCNMGIVGCIFIVCCPQLF